MGVRNPRMAPPPGTPWVSSPVQWEEKFPSSASSRQLKNPPAMSRYLFTHLGRASSHGPRIGRRSSTRSVAARVSRVRKPNASREKASRRPVCGPKTLKEATKESGQQTAESILLLSFLAAPIILRKLVGHS